VRNQKLNKITKRTREQLRGEAAIGNNRSPIELSR